MTKYQRSVLIASIGIIIFMAFLGWAGDIDFTEQTILNMSQEQYDSVKNHLTQQQGTEPSDSDIAHWWADHRE